MEHHIDETSLDYSYFLDRTTLLYGATSTGKSTIITDIMYLLKGHIDQCIVISPEDANNKTFSGGLVPSPFIHYRITPELLNSIWQRQEALGAVYERANMPSVLNSLFRKIDPKLITDVRDIISRMEFRRRECIHELQEKYLDRAILNNKRDDVNKSFSDFLSMIYKKYIMMHAESIDKKTLTPNEQFALKYIGLNPRLLLIFDDCSADLQKFKNNPILQKLFYQGRWAKITALISLHHNKLLPSELRGNARVSIFTQPETVVGLFSAKSNNFDKETIMRAYSATKDAFVEGKKHQKLIYFREDNKFYKFTATCREKFTFVSPIITEFCNKIQADGHNVDANNPFYKMFKD